MSLRSLDLVSEKLTPVEIKNKEFKRTVWGYAPQEVVDFLDATAKMWERVQKHEKELADEIRRLSNEVETWKRRETELDQLRERAREDASSIRNQATQEAEAFFGEVKHKAEEVRGKTEEWLATVISELEETEKKRDSIFGAIRASLDQHYELLDHAQANLKRPSGHLGSLENTENRLPS